LPLTEKSAEDVEDSPKAVCSTGEGSWGGRAEERSFRNMDLNQWIEAIVPEDLRIEHHDHVDSKEHFEHIHVQKEVDRTLRLWVCPIKIQMNLVALSPHGAVDPIWAVAKTIIVEVVSERDTFF
jgi:hypothetical protein